MNLQDSRGLRRFLIMWLGGGIATIIFLALVTGGTLPDHGWYGYLQLVRHGAVAEGVIVRTEPQNHCLAEYRFNISGKDYLGAGPKCGVGVGEKVLVTYHLHEPAHSCLGRALDRLEGDLAVFVLGALLFPPLIILGARAYTRERNEAAA